MTTLTAPPKILCYPARPVNGGPLDQAPQKFGEWAYEPKVNGWRALVHVPSWTLFNRFGKLLSIAREFDGVRESLRGLNDPMYEWLDVEAFERRHPHGRGSLVLLDLPLAPGTYDERQKQIAVLRHAEIGEDWDCAGAPPANSLLHFQNERAGGGAGGGSLVALQLWSKLWQANLTLRADVFEGVVAKRRDSKYPLQRRSPGYEFPFWMKHRWAF